MTPPLHKASSIELQTRRQQQRVELHKPISVININTHKKMGALVNITTEGFMLMSDTLIESNRIYSVSLQLPDAMSGHKQVDLGTDCLWSRVEVADKRYWAGFQIIDASRSALDRIEALISDFKQISD